MLKDRNFWREGIETAKIEPTSPPTSADVAIIGGGFTGLATALHLARAEFAWSGSVAYTFDHAPHVGQLDGIHYAMGYCGSGVTRSLYYADKLSRKILGQADQATVFDDLPFKSKPFYTGNPWFMAPVLRWHALIDRFSGH